MDHQTYTNISRLSGHGPRRECVSCGVHTHRTGHCKNCGGATRPIETKASSTTTPARVVVTAGARL